MKRMILIALLALALPMVAFASNSVDFTNSGGNLTGSSAGLTLTGSELIAVNGFMGGSLMTGDLGTVSFSTGAFTGSLQMGGTFSGTGSTFDIVGGSGSGLPSNLFSGSFTCSATSPCSWTLVTLANGTHNYTLTGTIQGTWYDGTTVSGATVQLTINTGKGYFNGRTTISSGDTNITTLSTPEPGTLALLGTGLVGIAGTLRRKLKA